MSKEINENSKLEVGGCCKDSQQSGISFKILITEYSKQNKEVIQNYISKLFFDEMELGKTFYNEFVTSNLDTSIDEMVILNTNNIQISTDIASQLASLNIKHKITR